jgi:hypothetical protein
MNKTINNIYRNSKIIFHSIYLIIFIYSTVSIFAQAKYEPPDGKIYHGVGWHIASQINYQNMFPAHRRPLLVQHMIAMPGTRGISVDRILQSFSQPHISPDSQYMEVSTHFEDRDGPLDSVFAFTNQIDSCIDIIADAFKQHGKPIFFRIGLEMNGAWNGYTPWIFPKAYRRLVEELRARNVNNIATVWCYEPDAPEDFADSTAQGWKWYPGDDVVDWFSLDPFPVEHFDPSLPDSSGGRITKKGKSELFLKFALQRGKPVYLNETTAHSAHLTPDSLDIDSVDGKHDWENWFQPFLQFLAIHPNIKAFNYINLDWRPYQQWAHWGDARIQINTYIKNRWVNALMDEKFLCAGYKIPDPINIKEKTITGISSLFSIHTGFYNNYLTISYCLPANQNVSIVLYTINGQLIEEIIDNKQAEGNHIINCPFEKLSSGMYILKCTFGKSQCNGKIAAIK